MHISHPREIYHSHFDVVKPIEQLQFDMLYVSNNVFKGIVYKYELTDTDVASRQKVARALNIKKSSEVATSCVPV